MEPEGVEMGDWFVRMKGGMETERETTRRETQEIFHSQQERKVKIEGSPERKYCRECVCV